MWQCQLEHLLFMLLREGIPGSLITQAGLHAIFFSIQCLIWYIIFDSYIANFQSCYQAGSFSSNTFRAVFSFSKEILLIRNQNKRNKMSLNKMCVCVCVYMYKIFVVCLIHLDFCFKEIKLLFFFFVGTVGIKIFAIQHWTMLTKPDNVLSF